MSTPPLEPADHLTGPTSPPLGGAAYGYPAPQHQPPRPRKVGPKVLTFSAIAVLLAGVVAGAVGAVGAAGDIADLIPSDVVTTEGTAGSDALALGPSTEPLAFEATVEGAYLVFEVSRGESARLPVSAVTAEGPSGPVSITPPDQTGSLPSNGWSVFPVGVLVPTENGSYTLAVDEQFAADDVNLAVGAPLNADSVAGIGGSGIIFLVGFLVGGLGLLLLIAGIIWWAVAKK